jgi:hypothetical protein
MKYYDAVVTNEEGYRYRLKYVKALYGDTTKVRCRVGYRYLTSHSEEDILFSYAISKYQHLISL